MVGKCNGFNNDGQMGNGEESPLVAWKHKGRANFSYEGSTYMIFKLWSKKGM